MSHSQALDRPDCVQGIAREDGVEPAVTHGTLPVAESVVLLHGACEIHALRGERSRTVPHGVGAEHADPLNFYIWRALGQDLQRVRWSDADVGIPGSESVARIDGLVLRRVVLQIGWQILPASVRDRLRDEPPGPFGVIRPDPNLNRTDHEVV